MFASTLDQRTLVLSSITLNLVTQDLTSQFYLHLVLGIRTDTGEYGMGLIGEQRRMIIEALAL